MGVTSCATLPFLPGTHVFSTVFKLLQANSTLFKHLWLVTVVFIVTLVSSLLLAMAMQKLFNRMIPSNPQTQSKTL